MYGRVLRSFSPAAALYVLLLSAAAFLAFRGFLLLGDPASLVQRILFGISALVALGAAVKALAAELWVQVVEGARSELAPPGTDRSWLPAGGRDILRLHWRYYRSSVPAREVFRTLLSDALAERSSPDGFRLLSSAEALTEAAPR